MWVWRGEDIFAQNFFSDAVNSFSVVFLTKQNVQKIECTGIVLTQREIWRNLKTEWKCQRFLWMQRWSLHCSSNWPHLQGAQHESSTGSPQCRPKGPEPEAKGLTRPGTVPTAKRVMCNSDEEIEIENAACYGSRLQLQGMQEKMSSDRVWFSTQELSVCDDFHHGNQMTDWILTRIFGRIIFHGDAEDNQHFGARIQSVISVWSKGHQVLVYEALSYSCMRPEATSTWGLILLVYETIS
jgi:hypothetical protein